MKLIDVVDMSRPKFRNINKEEVRNLYCPAVILSGKNVTLKCHTKGCNACWDREADDDVINRTEIQS